MKLDIQSLAILLSDYATYLREQNKKAKYLQSFAHPVLSIADNLDFRFLPRCETTPSLLTGLESRLAEKNEFEYVVVEDVCPSDPRRKYEYLQMLKSSGLALNAAMLIYTHGNNMGNTHFAWKVPEQGPDSFSQSQRTIEAVREQILTFHTSNATFTVAEVWKSCSKHQASCYRELTGDSCAAANEHIAEIDERVRLLLDMEDPDVVLDLRALHTGHKSQYDVFWGECQKFLEEVGTPVDDRRHSLVTHLARAISTRDLLEHDVRKVPKCLLSLGFGFSSGPSQTMLVQEFITLES